MMQNVLLATAYFPPVQYLSKIFQAENVLVEQYENYSKQSYRNRCIILSANGICELCIPIKKNQKNKFLTKDAQIDYATNWQKIHFKSIESAYRNSPFYDYYMDDFKFVFESKETFLLDLNQRILLTVNELLGISVPISLTFDYLKEIPDQTVDFRTVIHPKENRRSAEDTDFIPKKYTQTFGERFEFVPNLSILDLLFNEGPESPLYF